MNHIKIALVGQPNVGKSMLINSISNARMKVGNFAGVTVEKAEACLLYHKKEIQIVDLPGSYALNDYSLDEKVTKEFLDKKDYDLILNVVDSTNLERNLELTSDLLELNRKMIIALNMSDEARKEGIKIDAAQMSLLLGVPCIAVSAKEKTGLDTLLDTIIEIDTNPKRENKITYSLPIEEELKNLEEFFEERHFKEADRHTAIKLLKKDKNTYQEMSREPIWVELQPFLNDSFEHIYTHYQTKDVDEIFLEERDSFIAGILQESVEEREEKVTTITEKVDSLLLHNWLGIPIFLFMMWGLFQLTFELGSIPMDMIENLFSFFGNAVGEQIVHEGMRSLIVDGIIGGVGAVVLFLPNIVILFLGIALLETTGYISRVAFLLDGFFHQFGLHGKSFIPLVTGFGCSVPAYMAARTLKSKKDRLITMFIIGFMSCGAKLPVYVLFVGAFFSETNAGNILFLIYIAGALLGLVGAKFLEKFVFNGKDEPFVMEMPKYRLPSLKLIWHMVYSKALMYLKKAGTFILAASIIIWFASNYPKSETNQLENSYLGVIGKVTAPLFAPLGFDWKLTVALESGLAAKEVIVSTLGVLYSLDDEADETSRQLIDKIRTSIPTPTAMAFLAFVMLYLPCLAATAVFAKEAGNKKYVAYLALFTTAFAYIFAFIVYKITEFLV